MNVVTKKHVSCNAHTLAAEAYNRILLKLSGDGASFSQSTQFVLLTFSFPEIASDVLAASGV